MSTTKTPRTGRPTASAETWKASLSDLTGGEWEPAGPYAGHGLACLVKHRCGRVRAAVPKSVATAKGRIFCEDCRGPKSDLNRRSAEEWDAELRRLTGGSFEPAGPYAGKSVAATIRCARCGETKQVTPAHAANWARAGRVIRCGSAACAPRAPLAAPPPPPPPRATGQKAKTEGQWQADLAEWGEGLYECLTPYSGDYGRVLLRHRGTGEVRETTPNRLRRGAAPAGAGPRNGPWGRERYAAEVAAAFEGDKYEVLGVYGKIPGDPRSPANTPVLMRHLVCGTEWSPTPTNFLNSGTRCPSCADGMNSTISRRVLAALSGLLVPMGIGAVRTEHVFPDGPRSAAGRPLRFDYWVPELNLLVEADGELHEVPWRSYHGVSLLARQQDNDRRKDAWAEGRGLALLRVSWRDSDPEGAVRLAVSAAGTTP